MRSVSQCANACSLEVETKQRLCFFSAMIDIKELLTIIAGESVYSSTFSSFPNTVGSTGRAMWTTALRSPFLDFDMLNGENAA